MARDAFAFGDNRIDGVPCPVVEFCGEEPTQKELTVAEEYDCVVRDRFGIDEGTIPASVAESCWNQAISRIEQRSDHYRTDDPEHSEYLYGASILGREIADVIF